MSVTFNVSPELPRNLRKLERKFGTRFTRKLLKQAAKPLLEEAKSNSLKVDSSLSIYKALALVNEPNLPSVRLGVRLDKKYGDAGEKRIPFYYHMIENGVSPHVIKPRKAKALHFSVKGRHVVAKTVQHTGVRPRPFLRPAWERTKNDVYRNVAEQVKKGIFR